MKRTRVGAGGGGEARQGEIPRALWRPKKWEGYKQVGRVKQAAAVAYVAQCRRPARTIHTHVGTRARTEASGSLAALPSRHAAERNGGGVQPPPTFLSGPIVRRTNRARASAHPAVHSPPHLPRPAHPPLQAACARHAPVGLTNETHAGLPTQRRSSQSNAHQPRAPQGMVVVGGGLGAKDGDGRRTPDALPCTSRPQTHARAHTHCSGTRYSHFSLPPSPSPLPRQAC